MIRLWCFDLDGTLVDSGDDLTAAVNFMRATRKLPPLGRNRVLALLGCGRRMLVERALADAPPFPEAELDELEKIYEAYYAAHSCDRTRLFPGVPETLSTLRRRGGRVVLLTNKTASDARTILRKLAADAFFDRVVGDGDGLALKPEPDMLLAVMRQFATPPEETAMVGDNHTDLGAARRAGARAVFARYGFGVTGDETFDDAIGNFAELEELR